MNLEHNLESVDPLELFGQWLNEAEASEPNDANAAALATSNSNGNPSVRMVLVKRADERGFCFFTNAESKKGIDLQANPGQRFVSTGSRCAGRSAWRAG